MTVLIHVLGSDIPHHNQTILRFFNDSLAATSERARTSMVVGQDAGLSESCLALSLSLYSGKKAFADAVIVKTKADRQQRLFFHDRFDISLWLALLNDGIRPVQLYWYIQGADLYEVSSGLKFRLFHPIRHMAQNRVGCVSATRGDLHYFAGQHPRMRGGLLYFPTQMDPSLNNMSNDRQYSGKITVLVGNPGDRSNKHATALRAVHQQFGDTVNVTVPVGCPINNMAYIDKVRQVGLTLFSADNLQVLGERLEFDACLILLRQCDLGYFTLAHRQGIGTLCLLIQAGIPCMLNRKNPLWQDTVEQNLSTLFITNNLNEGVVCEAQRQLTLVDKNTITFLSPNCLQPWRSALRTVSGETIRA